MAAPTGAAAEQMRTLWIQVVDLTKQRAVNPTLYRALDKTIAITWEDDTFVVGIVGADGLMTGALNTAEYKAVVEKALRDITRNATIRFRFIEGSDYGDWEYVKQRDAATVSQQNASVQKHTLQSGTLNSWEDIHDGVARLWSQAEARSTSVGRGRYLAAAMEMVSVAMDRLYPKEGKADEANERGLSRVLDRIASMTQSDPAMVAYLLFEKRQRESAAQQP